MEKATDLFRKFLKEEYGAEIPEDKLHLFYEIEEEAAEAGYLTADILDEFMQGLDNVLNDREEKHTRA